MPQSLSNLLAHFVFSTKHRGPLITLEMQSRLYAYMGGIIRSEKCIPLQIGGMPDHVHALVKVHPTVAAAHLLQVFKANSSGWVNDTFQGPRFSWQNGYGAFSVGPRDVERVRSYIINQAEHHKAKTFQDEYREMLQEAGIEYDERYLWD